MFHCPVLLFDVLLLLPSVASLASGRCSPASKGATSFVGCFLCCFVVGFAVVVVVVVVVGFAAFQLLPRTILGVHSQHFCTDPVLPKC